MHLLPRNEGPRVRRPRPGRRIVLAVIGLAVLFGVDQSLAGWVVFALVLTQIVRVLAPRHAAWPFGLVALFTATSLWDLPWATAVGGASLPWVLLSGLSEIVFLVVSATAVAYAAQCSRTGASATWAGFRSYASAEIPRTAHIVARSVAATASKIRRPQLKG